MAIRVTEARVATILEGFLDPLKDARRHYEDYLSKRGSVLAGKSPFLKKTWPYLHPNLFEAALP